MTLDPDLFAAYDAAVVARVRDGWLDCPRFERDLMDGKPIVQHMREYVEAYGGGQTHWPREGEHESVG